MVIWPFLRLGLFVTLHRTLRWSWHVSINPVAGTGAVHFCVCVPLFHLIVTGPVAVAD